MNITSKNIFIKYSPMYMALSIIQISREKYLDSKRINNDIFNNLINIYGINPNDYKKCYDEIKTEINIENDNTSKNEEITDMNTENEKDIKYENDDLKNIERNKIFASKDKTVSTRNKIKSSKDIIYVKNNFLTNNNHISVYNTLTENIKDGNEHHSNESNSNDSQNTKSSKSIKKKKRITIDCDANIFNSKDKLPYINPYSRNSYQMLTIKEERTNNSRNYSYNKTKNNYHIKDLKHIRPNIQRYNSIESKNIDTNSNTPLSHVEKRKENKKGKSKFFSSSNKELYNKNIEIEMAKKNKFLLKHLVLEECKNDNIPNFNEDLNRPNNKYKKHYKLKVNNTERKEALPE